MFFCFQSMPCTSTCSLHEKLFLKFENFQGSVRSRLFFLREWCKLSSRSHIRSPSVQVVAGKKRLIVVDIIHKLYVCVHMFALVFDFPAGCDASARVGGLPVVELSTHYHYLATHYHYRSTHYRHFGLRRSPLLILRSDTLQERSGRHAE